MVSNSIPAFVNPGWEPFTVAFVKRAVFELKLLY